MNKLKERESYSRSIDIVIVVKTSDDKILIVQTSDGNYCLPHGYIKYYCTCAESASLILEEETGLYFEPSNIKFIRFDDNPELSEEQNVIFILKVNSTESSDELEQFLSIDDSEFSELDILSARFINIKNIDLYEWEENHEEIIEEVCFEKEKTEID